MYTPDSRQSWVAATRQINSSTTVIGAHINGWIFAEQTSTPAAPTASGSAPQVRSSGGSNTNSAIVFGIGVALAVVGLIVLVAGVVTIRGSMKTLRLVQSTIHIPNSRLGLAQEPSYQYRSMHQHSNGGFFLPVPARTRQGTPQPLGKEPQELDGSHPSS